MKFVLLKRRKIDSLGRRVVVEQLYYPKIEETITFLLLLFDMSILSSHFIIRESIYNYHFFSSWTLTLVKASNPKYISRPWHYTVHGMN